MILTKQIYTTLLMTATLAFANIAYAADWTLDARQSQLNFMSVKKGHIAENHQFKSLQGQLTAEGKLTINIDLASVDTGIAVRDQRMQEFLFNVTTYSHATLTADVDMTAVDTMAVATSVVITVPAQLNLHGQSKAFSLDVLVTKLSDASLVVVSAKPVLLNVADFDLVAGVAKLQELAKLPSISPIVPVTFYVTLNK